MKKILMLVGVLGLTACGGATLGDCPTDSVVAQKAGRALVAARCANCLGTRPPTNGSTSFQAT